MTNEEQELTQRVADLDADYEAMRLDFLRAVLEIDRIDKDEAMPAAEKVRRLKSFWDDFRWTPLRIEKRRAKGTP